MTNTQIRHIKTQYHILKCSRSVNSKGKYSCRIRYSLLLPDRCTIPRLINAKYMGCRWESLYNYLNNINQ